MKATFTFDLKLADHFVDNWWRKEERWPDTSIYQLIYDIGHEWLRIKCRKAQIKLF